MESTDWWLAVLIAIKLDAANLLKTYKLKMYTAIPNSGIPNPTKRMGTYSSVLVVRIDDVVNVVVKYSIVLVTADDKCVNEKSFEGHQDRVERMSADVTNYEWIRRRCMRFAMRPNIFSEEIMEI